MEWDLTSLTGAELDELAAWVALHKRHRELLHTGTMVRVDDTPESVRAHGVVAADASEAVYEIAVLGRPATWPPGPVRLPGLDPETVYRVRPLMPFTSRGAAPAWASGELELPGSALAAAGIAAPPLFPEQSVLVHVEAVSTTA
ncbi:GH36 C-terminal domain-containing protein [Nonomuraea sp. N2-4H]|uniref:GH36 C-terminal domain-containing protein n=1 Tax=Nonomuraea sp. N2-4H TaxID=3128898 RepID=UPI0038736D1A